MSSLQNHLPVTGNRDNCTVVQNLGRMGVKKTNIKIGGNEVISIDDTDVFQCYCDLWKTSCGCKNAAYQGIFTNNGRNVNRHRMAMSNKSEKKLDAAIAAAYGKHFYIPLDFELLETHMPYHHETDLSTSSLVMTIHAFSWLKTNRKPATKSRTSRLRTI